MEDILNGVGERFQIYEIFDLKGVKMSNNIAIVYRNLSELVPYENNPRKNDAAVGPVAQSIKEFGFKNPIILDKNDVIVAGHTRLLAAKKLGLDKVPCVVADDLTEEQIKAFRLADNKVSELAEWNADLLGEELKEITDIDMSEFGFELSEFDVDTTEIQEDEVPDVPEEAVCKLGDLWELGKHRLICGDSTDINVVDRLMDGVKADMLFTSPPYSDMREYNGGKDLSVSNVSNFISAYRPYVDYQCVNLGIQRKNHEIVQYWDEYIAKAKECGYKFLAWNVWNKMDCGSIGQHTAFIPICHEWIFVFGAEFFDINKTWDKKEENIREETTKCTQRQKDGTVTRRTHGDMSDAKKKMESVLSLLPEKHNSIRQLHPATFPVQLPAEYIKAMTNEGGSVIEPFGGSGSTLIACEQLNRKCYMAELDPHYCDVIIQRWENFTGKKARLLNQNETMDL